MVGTVAKQLEEDTCVNTLKCRVAAILTGDPERVQRPRIGLNSLPRVEAN